MPDPPVSAMMHLMTFRIRSIEGNRQHLDGGAMYGNAPRVLWAGWSTPDERHRIELACRAFLIEEEGRKILLEASIGNFFRPKLRKIYGVTELDNMLLVSLAMRGVKPEEIDLVVLSHLHFDHAGGLLTPWQEGQPYELVFPKAKFVIGKEAWERARSPHVRDRVSFIPELNQLLEKSGRVILVDQSSCAELGPEFSFFTSHGHTPGQLLTELTTKQGTVAFCGDLIPGRPWIHLPITMGYDRYPELLIDEKKQFFSRCLERDTRLLLTHDPGCALCGVTLNERGKYAPRDAMESVEDLQL